MPGSESRMWATELGLRGQGAGVLMVQCVHLRRRDPWPMYSLLPERLHLPAPWGQPSGSQSPSPRKLLGLLMLDSEPR